MIVQQLLTSFIASAAFGIIFNIPKKLLINCGFVGMVGWIIYFLFAEQQINGVAATFIASFFVAMISAIFARIYKTPVTIFSVSGIIPLVPGGLAYEAMRHVVLNDYNMAISLAVKAFMISGAIAMGLVFSEVINQIVKQKRKS
ncbi:threonine/serine exporter family protein [Parageobacillus thermoglucosidasius]|uniref:Threonine/serine exporter family protein n=2 Tax=Anoxybacillaceae TaxID=3120669 RepID=A0AB38R0S5_PARTM|nr:threonine/serine exporter family protein [Parageobacillus thermoglucosidasius]AEH48849.1 hypothetical protein Geoth_2968 [Parageobacillus thermoglucosidasius C56-YS93]MED4903237.1 threonine/serine exporter family protein [Parageobacillus thermoglucosidasius]MED4914686.1 threonine/serine exporter family protein [Parageobacillus thermoglucosidasius]MED4946311.1 threonine/serine exporter family protein [Parageobacillus thermoglucosidasius]MED4982507.1 threonine/serine exporter family protein [